MTGPIYTGGGDKGETSLVGSVRVSKDSARVHAVGTLDEANSHVGFARAAVDDPLLDGMLDFVQQRLFNCSSRIATPADVVAENTPPVTTEDVTALEELIDTITERMEQVGHFVVPGGCESASRLHVTRTVVRRAERALVALSNEDVVDEQVLAFVNRLSDLLFTAARYANHISGSRESHWNANANPPQMM